MSLLNVVSTAQEKQNTEGAVKRRALFDDASFVKGAEFHKNIIF